MVDIVKSSATLDPFSMSDFVRARSEEQKERRMEDIKSAADRLFSVRPYHEITLASIATELGCSRAQVYQYVTTKEEVFLELSGDKRRAYFDALLAACPPGCGYSHEVMAEVWAEILNAHRDFLRYADILMSIIETNVTVERLAQFKSRYYEELDAVVGRLAGNLGIDRARASALYYAVYFQAVGMGSYCYDNPLVQQAMALAGLEEQKPDFREEMRGFILMCLDRYCGPNARGSPGDPGERPQ